jgi:4-oxalocrotonate tautomerase
MIPERTAKGTTMPLVDIQLIEGVFDKSQKQEMIRKVTDAMLQVEGEAMRGVTWVRVHEVASGEWAIGGTPLTAADVKAMAAK